MSEMARLMRTRTEGVVIPFLCDLGEGCGAWQCLAGNGQDK
jgi:hypothetical protein